MEPRSKFFDSSTVQIVPRSGTIWTLFLPWLYLAIVALLVILVIAIFWPAIDRNQHLLTRKNDLTRKIEEEKRASLELQDHNLALQNDPIYIERKARDVLSVGHKGEVIFKFPPYTENSGFSSVSAKGPQPTSFDTR